MSVPRLLCPFLLLAVTITFTGHRSDEANFLDDPDLLAELQVVRPLFFCGDPSIHGFVKCLIAANIFDCLEFRRV